MERQGESPSAYPRLFNEESWKDLVPAAVHGPLKTAAAEFFQDAIGTADDSSQESLRARELSMAFYDGLNSDVVNNLGDIAINLSQAEADYGALFLKLAATPSGSGRDGLLRDLTLAREKLVRKEELAPMTTAARSLAEKIGWRGAVGKLQPGSSGERLQAIEQAVLQRLGYQDLRSLFESQAGTPRQVSEKFMGRKIEEVNGREGHELVEGGEEPVAAEAELPKNIFGKISRWLKGVDWKFVGRGSASMLAGIGLSELLGSASWIGGVLLGVNMLLRRVGGAEKVEGFIKSREAKYPKASEKMGTWVAMRVAMGELKLVQAALRVVESPEAMFVGAGLVAGAGIRQVRGLVNAARPGLPVEAQQAGAEWSDESRFAGGQATGHGPDTVGGMPVVQAAGGEYNPPFTGPNVPVAPEPLPPVTAGPGVELTSRAVEVMPGDTLTKLVSEAGGNAYGPDLTQTILKSADALTGPQNPNSELAKNLIDYLNSHPDVTWQDVTNGKYDSVMINGFPIKEVFSNAIHWIFPGQKFNVVVGVGVP